MVQGSIRGIATVLVENAEGELESKPMIVFGSSEVYVESKDLDLGSPNNDKYIDRIIFDIEAPDTVSLLSVQLGYRNRLQDPIVWLDPQDLDANNPQIEPRVEAKFFRLHFLDEFAITRWKLSRIEWYGRMMKGRL